MFETKAPRLPFDVFFGFGQAGALPRTRLGLTRVGDGDLVLGLAGLRSLSLNGLDDILSRDDFAEDGVLAIEPWAWYGGDEELRSAVRRKGKVQVRGQQGIRNAYADHRFTLC